MFKDMIVIFLLKILNDSKDNLKKLIYLLLIGELKFLNFFGEILIFICMMLKGNIK